MVELNGNDKHHKLDSLTADIGCNVIHESFEVISEEDGNVTTEYYIDGNLVQTNNSEISEDKKINEKRFNKKYFLLGIAGLFLSILFFFFFFSSPLPFTKTSTIDITDGPKIFTNTTTSTRPSTSQSPSQIHKPSQSQSPTIKQSSTNIPSLSPTSQPSLSSLILTQVGPSIQGDTKYQFIGKSVSLSHDGTTLAVSGSDQIHIYHRVNKNSYNKEWQLFSANATADLNQIPAGVGESFVTLSSNGQLLCVSLPMSDTKAVNGGEVHIFINQNMIWKQLGQTLYGNAPYDYFGNSVAISNHPDLQNHNSMITIAIGAIGGMYVSIYQLHPSSLHLDRKTQIQAPSKSVYGFAHQIALSDSDNIILAIGAPWAAHTQTGSVFLYDLTWIEKVPVQIMAQFNGKQTNDWFGYSVSLSSKGDRLAIGASKGNYVAVFTRFHRGLMDWNLLGNAIINPQTIIDHHDDTYSTSISSSDSLGSLITLSGDGTLIAIGDTCNANTQNNTIHLIKLNHDTWTTVYYEFTTITQTLGNNNIPFEYSKYVNTACLMSMSLSSDGQHMAFGIMFGDNDEEKTRGDVKVYQVF